MLGYEFYWVRTKKNRNHKMIRRRTNKKKFRAALATMKNWIKGARTWPLQNHRLIRDEAGKRLAKRDDARAISLFREQGASPTDIRQMVGLPATPYSAGVMR